MNSPNLIIVVPASGMRSASVFVIAWPFSGHPPNTTTSVSSGLIPKTAAE